MDRKQILEVRQDLEALAIEFWNDVDFNGGRNAHNYYVEDAVFTTSVRTIHGREAIRAFYAARQARGARTSVHLVQNFCIRASSAREVGVRYVMTLHAADGEGVLPSKPAIMIAEVCETALRQADGSWLYTARTIKALFRDDTPTTG